MNVSTPVRNHNINLNCDVTPVEKINNSLNGKPGTRSSPRLASNKSRLSRALLATSPVLSSSKRKKHNSTVKNSQQSSDTSDSGVYSNPQKEISRVSLNASSDIFGDSITSDIIPVSLKKNLDAKSKSSDISGASLFNNDSGFNVINQSPKDNVNKTLEETINLSDQLRQRLLNNVDNVTYEKISTTGWSQLEDFDQSVNIPAVKESGPFFGLPMKVKDLLKEHKGIEDLYGIFKKKNC